MHVMFKTLPCLGAACALAFAAACNSTPSSPTNDAGAGTALVGDAAADGSTLKVSAPTPVSPTGDLRLENRRPTMTADNANGRFANVPFTYEFQLLDDAGRTLRTQQVPQGSGRTTWVYPEDLERDTPYRWQVRALYEGAFGPWSPQARFFTVAEKRTPDPPPGGRIPRPDWAAPIVFAAFAQRPDLVRRSCQSHGGTWEFMDYIVDQLRLEDTRFGYNCKRGNCADPSHDVIAYNRGPGPDQGARDVWIIDVILGHCGDAPAPTWDDVTQITIDSGAGRGWTSRGRF